jgi:hypothetical protein
MVDEQDTVSMMHAHVFLIGAQIDDVRKRNPSLLATIIGPDLQVGFARAHGVGMAVVRPAALGRPKGFCSVSIA